MPKLLENKMSYGTERWSYINKVSALQSHVGMEYAMRYTQIHFHKGGFLLLITKN